MRTAKRTVFNEINITPLTDIFLVLLIIMIVVAPMLETSGLRLVVPSIAPSEEVKEDPKTISLQVLQDGSFEVDGKQVPGSILSIRLRELKTEKPDGVVIEADPESLHESLAKAMDAAQVAGITKVAVTEKGTDAASADANQAL